MCYELHGYNEYGQPKSQLVEIMDPPISWWRWLIGVYHRWRNPPHRIHSITLGCDTAYPHPLASLWQIPDLRGTVTIMYGMEGGGNGCGGGGGGGIVSVDVTVLGGGGDGGGRGGGNIERLIYHPDTTDWELTTDYQQHPSGYRMVKKESGGD